MRAVVVKGPRSLANQPVPDPTPEILDQDRILPQSLVNGHTALDAVAETREALAQPTTRSKILVRP